MGGPVLQKGGEADSGLLKEALRAFRFLAEDLRSGPVAPQWLILASCDKDRIAIIATCGKGARLMWRCGE